MPFGVETITILDFFEEEIVGNTDAMNSSAKFGFKKANSSSSKRLIELPRTASAEVAAQETFEPFSKINDVLFHSTTPCCNHFGQFETMN